MAHLQYMPGDPRLVDQLVYELKSKGIFDQFRKECIADVDTRPAYQNLRQRVENSVTTFLSRQCWKPDLNKNQLREKLRKHILDGNYLEQGVERIVDQVVNPKVTTVFIPQVEDLVYNYFGITRKKAPTEEENDKNTAEHLSTDLEAVSPGSVKSDNDKTEPMDTEDTFDKLIASQNEQPKLEEKIEEVEKKIEDVEMSEVVISQDTSSMDKSGIPLPDEELKLENIPAPENSPPKVGEVELDSIALPHEPNPSTDIPLPEETLKINKEQYFKPLCLNSDDSNSSSDSSLRRNMSPLTPIRNFNNENSCDAQQGFEDDSDTKSNDKTVANTFHFAIENKDAADSNINIKDNKKESELSYQFNSQVNINTYNTPLYEDSSNSNNLQIDYESDVNSKTNIEIKPEESSQEYKKEKKSEDKKSTHKSSHRSRDSSRHSSSKDKRSDSKHSASRDSSRNDKKYSSRDDKSKSSKESDKSKDRNDKKDSRDSSKNRSSHKSSSNREKDSKSHRSSSHRHSSKNDDRKSSSSKDKGRISESSRDKNKDKPRDSKSSSHRSDKDRKGSSSSNSKKTDDKDKKKDKKDIDDHYSSSGRGNHSRRSTDRDSNDGSSSSKGSRNHNNSKIADNKKDGKSSSSKSDNTSITGDSASPSDKEQVVLDNLKMSQCKPVVRVDNHLETPIANPPRLPFVPDVTLKKPRFAANLEEAKKLMKMRKFLDEEQKRMNQEAALLLEFQANVRPSLSQVYSSIPGPELEFACMSHKPQEKPFEDARKQCGISEDKEINSVGVDNNMEIPSTKAADMEDKNKLTQTSEEIHELEMKIENESKDLIESVEGSENTELVDPSTSFTDPEKKAESTYDENKPFSELMDEIKEYSKASEEKNKVDNVTDKEIIDTENLTDVPVTEESKDLESIIPKYFEVTVITEELSESEELENAETKKDNAKREENVSAQEIVKMNDESVKPGEIAKTEKNTNSEEIANAEEIAKTEETVKVKQHVKTEVEEKIPNLPEPEFQYFAEHEKYNAELKKHEYDAFLKSYIEQHSSNKKLHIINCDSYEEKIVREIAATFGNIDVINYHKNGHVKLPNKIKNVVKDVTLSSEITLPIESTSEPKSQFSSPVKSDCSFELCSEFDAKLEEINKKSRQEVMEIILGSVVDASPSKMPKIDYYTENHIEASEENIVQQQDGLKRTVDDIESTVNNNSLVLTPNKMRRLSDTDQISSTTEESVESTNNNKVTNTRSKYLGRARRVGLPRPKRCPQSNSPSSDKSVENYAQNSPTPAPKHNGKMKTTPRTKVQRYDTSDLYKPKLHYLSRRNNIT